MDIHTKTSLATVVALLRCSSCFGSRRQPLMTLIVLIRHAASGLSSAIWCTLCSGPGWQQLVCPVLKPCTYDVVGNRLLRRQGSAPRQATWLARPLRLPRRQCRLCKERHPWYSNTLQPCMTIMVVLSMQHVIATLTDLETILSVSLGCVSFFGCLLGHLSFRKQASMLIAKGSTLQLCLLFLQIMLP